MAPREAAPVRAVVRWLRSVRTLPRGRAVTALIQGAKGLIAALVAWEVASWWLPGSERYPAVATALLMVGAPTIHRSVTQAVRSVGTRAAGLALAAAVVWLLGSTAGSVAAVLAIALFAGAGAGGRRSAENRLQVGSTAVLALTVAATTSMGDVAALVLATLAGAAVGTVVNALVLPPLHLADSDASVSELATSMGELLGDMGRGLRERRYADQAHAWLEQGRHLEELVTQAHEDVERGQESLRWNTRCAVRGVGHGKEEPPAHGEALRALHRVSFQVRGIARTLADNVDDRHTDHHLGRLFLERYAATLEAAGHAVTSFAALRTSVEPGDPHARDGLRRGIGDAAVWHRTMTDLIAHGSLPEPGAWHVYGSLMTDVERLLADLDHADRFTATAERQPAAANPDAAEGRAALS